MYMSIHWVLYMELHLSSNSLLLRVIMVGLAIVGELTLMIHILLNWAFWIWNYFVACFIKSLILCVNYFQYSSGLGCHKVETHSLEVKTLAEEHRVLAGDLQLFPGYITNHGRNHNSSISSYLLCCNHTI